MSKTSGFSMVLAGSFASFRHPGVTDPSYVSYRLIPRPTLLGLFGSILGLSGYRESNTPVPEYFQQLGDLSVAIQPVQWPEDGGLNSPESFQPTTSLPPKYFVEYNNYHGYGSSEPGGNLVISEQVLYKPAFRIFVLENEENDTPYEKLRDRIKEGRARYTPYLGKNEFPATILFENERSFRPVTDTISSINSVVSNEYFQETDTSSLDSLWEEVRGQIFPDYPVDMNTDGQYQFQDMVFTNRELQIPGQTKLFFDDGEQTIQIIK